MALTKTDEISVYTIASTASNSASIGAALDVSTYYGGVLRIRMGRGTGTAFTVGPKVRVEGTPETGAETADQWAVLAQFQMGIGGSIASQAFGGSEAAGQTVLTMAAGTNFAAGDYVFIHDNTLSSSEWVRVVSVSGADLTIEEGTVNAHDASDTARDQAEQYVCALDLTAINALRIVVDNAGTGQAVICQVTGGFVSGL